MPCAHAVPAIRVRAWPQPARWTTAMHRQAFTTRPWTRKQAVPAAARIPQRRTTSAMIRQHRASMVHAAPAPHAVLAPLHLHNCCPLNQSSIVPRSMRSLVRHRSLVSFPIAWNVPLGSPRPDRFRRQRRAASPVSVVLSSRIAYARFLSIMGRPCSLYALLPPVRSRSPRSRPARASRQQRSLRPTRQPGSHRRATRRRFQATCLPGPPQSRPTRSGARRMPSLPARACTVTRTPLRRRQPGMPGCMPDT